MNSFYIQALLTLFFITIVFLHVVKKNITTAIVYSLQSLIIVLLLVDSFFATGNASLLFVACLTLVVKVILAPAFFINLVNKFKLKFLVTTYVNTPLTLISVTILTAFAHSKLFTSLAHIVPSNEHLLYLALSAIFISLFLIVNCKVALSQITGVLSLENSIVIFGIFAGLEQSPILQIGIVFDIFVWTIIATVFIGMIHKHFGSLDVTEMKSLKD